MTIQFINRPAPFALDPAVALLGNEPEGLAIDFARDRAYVRDRAVAANNYLGNVAGRFPVVRGTGATYFDAARALRTAGPNVLRLDHDPVTGKALGVRLEGAAGTLTKYTTNFAEGINGDPVVSLFAGRTAQRWTTDGGASRGQQQAYTDPGGICTASWIVERTALSHSQFSFGIYRGGWLTLRNYSWLAGAINGSVGTLAPISQTVTPLGIGPNGGEMVLVTLTIETTSGNTQLFFYPSSTNSHPAGSQTILHYAAVTTDRIAASPIIADDQTAQRLADNLSFARPGTPESTVVIRGRTAAGIGAISQTLWQWDAGSSNRYYLFRRNTDRSLIFAANVGGANVVALNMGVLADNADFAVAASMEVGQHAASHNGAPAVGDTNYSGPMPVVDTFRPGLGTTPGSQLGGTIKSLRLTPRPTDPSLLPGLLS